MTVLAKDLLYKSNVMLWPNCSDIALYTKKGMVSQALVQVVTMELTINNQI